MTLFLVCGGRNFGKLQPTWKYSDDPEKREIYKERLNELKFIYRTLDDLELKYQYEGPIHVIHGGAKGADTVAGEWGKSKGFDVTVFKPDVDSHGSPAAFFIRNDAMAKYAEVIVDEDERVVCVAFPGGNGTKDMFSRIEKLKVISGPIVQLEDFKREIHLKNAYKIKNEYVTVLVDSRYFDVVKLSNGVTLSLNLFEKLYYPVEKDSIGQDKTPIDNT